MWAYSSDPSESPQDTRRGFAQFILWLTWVYVLDNGTFIRKTHLVCRSLFFFKSRENVKIDFLCCFFFLIANNAMFGSYLQDQEGSNFPDVAVRPSFPTPWISNSFPSQKIEGDIRASLISGLFLQEGPAQRWMCWAERQIKERITPLLRHEAGKGQLPIGPY